MTTGFHIIRGIIENLFLLFFLYRAVFFVAALVKKPEKYKARRAHRYALLICAKNEHAVLGKLIHSLQDMDYPKDRYSIFVVADNCSDSTADVARRAGVIVYERTDLNRRGKGYALRFLLRRIKADFGFNAYDGYAVFDADNLVHKKYLSEINKMFDNGCRIITPYRGSKNFASSWVSGCSSLWFMIKSGLLNCPRTLLSVGCPVSGTGFVMHRDIVKRIAGWKYFSLAENMEFSADQLLSGERAVYCPSAVVYDEQPVRFVDSWTQRMRWVKGYYQVSGKYGLKLLKYMFKGVFTCYDMGVTLAAGWLFIAGCVLTLVINSFEYGFGTPEYGVLIGHTLIRNIIIFYIIHLVYAIVTVVTDMKRIYCPPLRKLEYIILYPVFVFTYIPMAFLAPFMPARWLQVKHSISISTKELHKVQ